MSPSLTSGVTAVSAGYNHSLAVQNGAVWAWGKNTNGELGVNPGQYTYNPTPNMVNGLSNIVAVAAGDGYSLALDQHGNVWAWGYNFNGQLGDGTTNNCSTPELLTSITGVAAIATGNEHSLALKSDGSVWVWGMNSSGELGDGTTNRLPHPGTSRSLSRLRGQRGVVQYQHLRAENRVAHPRGGLRG